jgi:alpha-tubulin suppressor-like RCC1 family protein
MDITQVAAGGDHTVGLKSDGTVVAVGRNYLGQCNVGGWMDITQIAAGWDYTVGVKSDGTVVAVGDNEVGQCNVGG